jgi:hypothetical protein
MPIKLIKDYFLRGMMWRDVAWSRLPSSSSKQGGPSEQSRRKQFQRSLKGSWSTKRRGYFVVLQGYLSARFEGLVA